LIHKENTHASTISVAVFHFTVQWRHAHWFFRKLRVLTQENQAIGVSRWFLSGVFIHQNAGLRKFSNITLKRGIIKSDNDFFKWLSTVKTQYR